jgi:hypothetical protein
MGVAKAMSRWLMTMPPLTRMDRYLLREMLVPLGIGTGAVTLMPVSYTHLRAHET